MFKLILLFQIPHINITMHDYNINNYGYCHNYFTVCAFQVTSFMVALIQLIIISNIEVREVV